MKAFLNILYVSLFLLAHLGSIAAPKKFTFQINNHVQESNLALRVRLTNPGNTPNPENFLVVMPAHSNSNSSQQRTRTRLDRDLNRGPLLNTETYTVEIEGVRTPAFRIQLVRLVGDNQYQTITGEFAERGTERNPLTFDVYTGENVYNFVIGSAIERSDRHNSRTLAISPGSQIQSSDRIDEHDGLELSAHAINANNQAEDEPSTNTVQDNVLRVIAGFNQLAVNSSHLETSVRDSLGEAAPEAGSLENPTGFLATLRENQEQLVANARNQGLDPLAELLSNNEILPQLTRAMCILFWYTANKHLADNKNA